MEKATRTEKLEEISRGSRIGEAVEVSDSAVSSFTGKNEKPHFHSNFKAWIRVVAFVVVAIFIPQQVAQAVEYDWRVLWQRPAVGTLNTFAPAYLKDTRSLDIPLAVRNILKDISGKSVNAIRLSPELTLKLEKPLNISKQRIDEIYEWLKGRPCGTKALYDYLTYAGAQVAEQDIAVLALTVDILNGVVKPEGNPEVIKNSLFALSQASAFFGHKLYPAKIDFNQGQSPKNNTLIDLSGTVPFIAHLKGDHYVLVARISGDKVYFIDEHKEEFLPSEKFLEGFSGYILSEKKEAVGLTAIADSEAKLILGARRYRGKYPDLSPLFQQPDLRATAINLGMTVLTAIPGICSGGITDLAVAQFTGQLGTIATYGLSKTGMNPGLVQAISTLATTAFSYGVTTKIEPKQFMHIKDAVWNAQSSFTRGLQVGLGMGALKAGARYIAYLSIKDSAFYKKNPELALETANFTADFLSYGLTSGFISSAGLTRYWGKKDGALVGIVPKGNSSDFWRGLAAPIKEVQFVSSSLGKIAGLGIDYKDYENFLNRKSALPKYKSVNGRPTWMDLSEEDREEWTNRNSFSRSLGEFAGSFIGGVGGAISAGQPVKVVPLLVDSAIGAGSTWLLDSTLTKFAGTYKRCEDGVYRNDWGLTRSDMALIAYSGSALVNVLYQTGWHGNWGNILNNFKDNFVEKVIVNYGTLGRTSPAYTEGMAGWTLNMYINKVNEMAGIDNFQANADRMMRAMGYLPFDKDKDPLYLKPYDYDLHDSESRKRAEKYSDYQTAWRDFVKDGNLESLFPKYAMIEYGAATLHSAAAQNASEFTYTAASDLWRLARTVWNIFDNHNPVTGYQKIKDTINIAKIDEILKSPDLTGSSEVQKIKVLVELQKSNPNKRIKLGEDSKTIVLVSEDKDKTEELIGELFEPLDMKKLNDQLSDKLPMGVLQADLSDEDAKDTFTIDVSGVTKKHALYLVTIGKNPTGILHKKVQNNPVAAQFVQWNLPGWQPDLPLIREAVERGRFGWGDGQFKRYFDADQHYIATWMPEIAEGITSGRKSMSMWKLDKNKLLESPYFIYAALVRGSNPTVYSYDSYKLIFKDAAPLGGTKLLAMAAINGHRVFAISGRNMDFKLPGISGPDPIVSVVGGEITAKDSATEFISSVIAKKAGKSKDFFLATGIISLAVNEAAGFGIAKHAGVSPAFSAQQWEDIRQMVMSDATGPNIDVALVLAEAALQDHTTRSNEIKLKPQVVSLPGAPIKPSIKVADVSDSKVSFGKKTETLKGNSGETQVIVREVSVPDRLKVSQTTTLEEIETGTRQRSTAEATMSRDVAVAARETPSEIYIFGSTSLRSGKDILDQEAEKGKGLPGSIKASDRKRLYWYNEGGAVPVKGRDASLRGNTGWTYMKTIQTSQTFNKNVLVGQKTESRTGYGEAVDLALEETLGTNWRNITPGYSEKPSMLSIQDDKIRKTEYKKMNTLDVLEGVKSGSSATGYVTVAFDNTPAAFGISPQEIIEKQYSDVDGLSSTTGIQRTISGTGKIFADALKGLEKQPENKIYALQKKVGRDLLPYLALAATQEMPARDIDYIVGNIKFNPTGKPEDVILWGSFSNTAGTRGTEPAYSADNLTARQIQASLNKAGFYPYLPDGIKGSLTKKAITDFQSANGLKPDGIVGPKTWGALEEKTASPDATAISQVSFNYNPAGLGLVQDSQGKISLRPSLSMYGEMGLANGRFTRARIEEDFIVQLAEGKSMEAGRRYVGDGNIDGIIFTGKHFSFDENGKLSEIARLSTRPKDAQTFDLNKEGRLTNDKELSKFKEQANAGKMHPGLTRKVYTVDSQRLNDALEPGRPIDLDNPLETTSLPGMEQARDIDKPGRTYKTLVVGSGSEVRPVNASQDPTQYRQAVKDLDRTLRETGYIVSGEQVAGYLLQASSSGSGPADWGAAAQLVKDYTNKLKAQPEGLVFAGVEMKQTSSGKVSLPLEAPKAQPEFQQAGLMIDQSGGIHFNGWAFGEVRYDFGKTVRNEAEVTPSFNNPAQSFGLTKLGAVSADGRTVKVGGTVADVGALSRDLANKNSGWLVDGAPRRGILKGQVAVVDNHVDITYGSNLSYNQQGAPDPLTGFWMYSLDPQQKANVSYKGNLHPESYSKNLAVEYAPIQAVDVLGDSQLAKVITTVLHFDRSNPMVWRRLEKTITDEAGKPFTDKLGNPLINSSEAWGIKGAETVGAVRKLIAQNKIGLVGIGSDLDNKFVTFEKIAGVWEKSPGYADLRLGAVTEGGSNNSFGKAKYALELVGTITKDGIAHETRYISTNPEEYAQAMEASGFAASTNNAQSGETQFYGGEDTQNPQKAINVRGSAWEGRNSRMRVIDHSAAGNHLVTGSVSLVLSGKGLRPYENLGIGSKLEIPGGYDFTTVSPGTQDLFPQTKDYQVKQYVVSNFRTTRYTQVKFGEDVYNNGDLDMQQSIAGGMRIGGASAEHPFSDASLTRPSIYGDVSILNTYYDGNTFLGKDVAKMEFGSSDNPMAVNTLDPRYDVLFYRYKGKGDINKGDYAGVVRDPITGRVVAGSAATLPESKVTNKLSGA